VLVLLHEKYARVTELTELVPLAFQVLRFKMLDAHRKSLRRGEYNQESVDDLPLANPGDDPATLLDQKQRVDRLLAAVAQLGRTLPRPVQIEIGGTQFPGDSNAHGTAFDQHHLHLGSPLPKTVVEFDGRHVGMP
jgi:RNA polymerase sigma-70 factor (ECF subfamily)